MIVVSDVDLSLLTKLYNYGSLQTLKDRRLDLYNLSFKENEDVIIELDHCGNKVDRSKPSV